MLTAAQLKAARALLGIDQRTLAQMAGLSLPSGCRSGQCESCCLRLVSGSASHLAPYDGDPDTCLTCCAVPLSDLVLDA